MTGCLPLSNGLLVIPDGDPPLREDRVNMKRFLALFGPNSILSTKKRFSLIKTALTEFYLNLSYITLGGARDFSFDAESDLTAKLSFSLKHATFKNLEEREDSHIANAYNRRSLRHRHGNFRRAIC